MNMLSTRSQPLSLQALLRNLLTAAALLGAIALSLPDLAHAQEPDAQPLSEQSPSNVSSMPATGSPLAANPLTSSEPTAEAPAEETLLAADMSPWGMFQNADVIVRGVMIGLALASVLTWTIWLSKGLELLGAKRRLQHELSHLKQARSLPEAQRNATGLSRHLIEDAQDELQLSANARGNDGIKERVSFRLERLVAASGRQMSRGTGVLATIGSTAPFVGLFGTVWGIMNSFIGIAKSQTTNIAVVAPGIAEALLATALGLVAAIPAVVIYNVFARSIAGYKAQVADASAQVLLLVSRDLDLPNPEQQMAPLPAKIQPHMVKAG
ncbi:MAG: tonB-system energizer ExbB [Pseudomonas sp.]|nr:tonB-system energizer ExbB [Pseudomonas sp.]